MKVIERASHILHRLWELLRRPPMLVLPGTLAFFFLLAIVPTITLIAYGASFFHVSFEFISEFLLKAFGESIRSLIMPVIEEIKFSPQVLLPLTVAFIAASGGANSIIVISNELYHFPNKSYLRRCLKAMAMTFIIISLILFFLFLPAFGDRIIELVRYVNMNRTVTFLIVFLIHLSKGPISWILMFCLIKIIYTFAPDTNIPSAATTKGSLFTTFGFIVSTGIYSFYVNHFAHYDVLYGGLSHFVVLMIWFYILSYIIAIGIAINADEVNRLEKKGMIKKEEK